MRMARSGRPSPASSHPLPGEGMFAGRIGRGYCGSSDIPHFSFRTEFDPTDRKAKIGWNGSDCGLSVRGVPWVVRASGSRAAILVGLWVLAGRADDGSGAQEALKPTDAGERCATRGGIAGRGGATRSVYKGRCDGRIGSSSSGPTGAIPVGTTIRLVPGRGGRRSQSTTRRGTKIRFTVPADARRLAFLATIADDRGSPPIRVTVPISDAKANAGAPPASPMPTPGTSATMPAPPPFDHPVPGAPWALPVADAGDDQIGLVGRRINTGGRSRPTNQVGYRWMHLSPGRRSPRRSRRGRTTGGLSAPKIGLPAVVGHRDQVLDAERRGGRGRPAPGARPRPSRRRWRGGRRTPWSLIPGSVKRVRRSSTPPRRSRAGAPCFSTGPSFWQLQQPVDAAARRGDPCSTRHRGASLVEPGLCAALGDHLHYAAGSVGSTSACRPPPQLGAVWPAKKERIGAFSGSLAVAFRPRMAVKTVTRRRVSPPEGLICVDQGGPVGESPEGGGGPRPSSPRSLA